ncbi:hypothetical protein HPB47_004088, partial [Ixodes persulcatus]
LNRSARSTFVSPLKPPSEVTRRDRPAYVKRKQTELEQVVTENSRSRMRLAYDENVASGSSEQKCSTCTEWADNIRRAFATTASPRERCQLLTLLPSALTRNEVQKIIPEASIYIINRSRKLRDDHGVWYVPDPYTRCKMTTMKDLSDEATLCLIALVEEFPQLWCLQNDQYRNSGIKSELWKQIENEMERRYCQYGPYTE